jgi:hypothetical protein
LAGFFKLFRVNFLATRVCLFLTSLGVALLMYLLSRRVCRTYQFLPAIILASTIFGGLWPAISHHADSTFLGLLAVACATQWIEKRSNSLLVAAGAAAGLTTAFLQPKGMLLFCAILVWLKILHRRRIASLYSIGAVTAGYLGVVGIVLLYFCTKGALGDLLFVNFTWPSQHYSNVNSVPYAHGILSNYFDHWIINKNGFRWTIPLAAIVFVPLLFIAALPALLIAVAARSGAHSAKPEILLYWLSGSAIWLSELHRMDMPRLVFGSPLLIILCVYLLTEYRRRLANAALQALSTTAVCLATFNLLCVLAGAHAVKTRIGSVQMFRDAAVLTYLQQHIAPGEEIFAYPYCPRYYFLAAATNPTPYSILVYNYNTASQFQETVQILNQHKVKYVVWDDNFAKATIDVFPGSTQMPPGGLIMEPYLESHYNLVQVVDGIRIMQRKIDASSD